jgi:hypothetical protein
MSPSKAAWLNIRDTRDPSSDFDIGKATHTNSKRSPRPVYEKQAHEKRFQNELPLIRQLSRPIL